jgi:TetR/AcrR family transcriptional regulator of autoinduction and epiphytic fitness
MSAALEVFLQNGYAASSMADIAARAEIGKGTCYKYFSTKEQLFEQVLREVVIAPVAEIKARDPRDFASVKSFLVEVLLPFMTAFQDSERSLVARLIIAEGEHFPSVAEIYAKHVYTPFIEVVRNCAAIALESGELAQPELLDNPELLIAPMWFGIIHNHILCPKEPVDIGKLEELQLQMMFRS